VNVYSDDNKRKQFPRENSLLDTNNAADRNGGEMNVIA
jgi:hypothetical protein